MEEKKDLNEDLQRRRSRFKMNPPEETWNRLDANLERQRAIQYRQRGNRFRLLSIGLALLLLSFVTYTIMTTKSDRKNGEGVLSQIAERAENKGAATSATLEKGIATNGEIKAQVNANAKEKVVMKESVQAKTNAVKNTNYPENTTAEKSKVEKVITENAIQQKADVELPFAANKKKDVAENHSAPSAKEETKANNGIVENNSESPVNKGDSIASKSFKDSVLEKEKGKITHWVLSGFYGPDVFAKNRLKILKQQFADIINSYSELSTQDYSFNSGLLLGYRINKSWSVSTGGIYSTISYSSVYPTLRTSLGRDNLYHYKYRTSCGSIEIPNEDNVVLTSRDSLKSSASCSQVIKQISIPLMVKYQLTAGHFNVYGTTGFAANIVLQEVAKLGLDNDKYTLVNSAAGLQKTNYSYLLGMGLDYDLWNGMSIFMEPSFRTAITSQTENGFFNCFPYSFGLKLGISLNF